MRAILDAILAFIGSESLTDIEFASLDTDALGTDLLKYAALLGVLDSRESVSSQAEKLRYYYLAKGVSVSEIDDGKSNILIGDEL